MSKIVTATEKVSTQCIREIERAIDYRFREKNLLLKAIQAPGLHRVAGNLNNSYGNKKIASVGDAVLELLVREKVYHSGLSGEEATRVRYGLVSNRNLIHVCKRTGIYEHLRQDHPRLSENNAAASMEGIIGGVYLDGGLESASKVLSILGLLPVKINPSDKSSDEHDHNKPFKIRRV